MTHITRIGIDLAKPVFQLHGVEEHGHTGLRPGSRAVRCGPWWPNCPRAG